jgi:hypothetical protein
VSGKGEKRNAYTFLVGKHEEKRLLGNISLCGRIILKRILNMIEWHGLDSSSSG